MYCSSVRRPHLVKLSSLSKCYIIRALARAGKQVLHVDRNAYYGSQEASFALDELVAWAKAQQQDALSDYTNVAYDFGPPPSSSAECPPELLKRSRRYALSLRPVLVPANGPFIDALVSSGVASYTSFRLLETTVIYQKDSEDPFKRVPSSKEDVFKSDELNLINKRRLMKFLTFAAGEFEHSEHLKSGLLYLCERVKRTYGLSDSPTIGGLLRKQFGLTDPLLNVVLYAVCYCQSEDGTSVLMYLDFAQALDRRCTRCSEEPTQIPTLDGQIRQLFVLGRAVWWYRRDCARLC